MRGLITDREQSNVDRLKELSSKGWSNMTDDEKAEWIGDPKTVVGANLFARGSYQKYKVDLIHRSDHLIATAYAGGTYQYIGVILGPASDFEGKTLTLSVDSIVGTPGASPRISLFWHDVNGAYEFAGLQLISATSVTARLTENTNKRQFLAAYVYVSISSAVSAGAMMRYDGVMLTIGNTKHPFVPYTEIVATPATKGAYNYSDLNRVELAVSELSDTYGLGLITKTDWTATDVPSEQLMERYLSNIRVIRTVCPDQSNLPVLPEDMTRLTYEDANNIEKILVAAYAGVAGSYRSGEIYSGEV